jgi:hypothetical protein
MPEVFVRFRKEENSESHVVRIREKSGVSDLRNKEPNKAPEPTPTAVTPRATEMNIEVKPWNCNRNEARVVPAAVVAHL